MNATRFKRIRQALGTQKKVAEMLGYKEASISLFERGGNIPLVVDLAMRYLWHKHESKQRRKAHTKQQKAASGNP